MADDRRARRLVDKYRGSRTVVARQCFVSRDNIVSVFRDAGVPSEIALLCIDIAVPRDLDPRLGEIPGVLLYNVDDLEAVSAGVVASGHVDATWVAECRRCLRPIEGAVTAGFRELFEQHPTEGETWPLRQDRVDLEPLARETVLGRRLSYEAAEVVGP